MTQEKSLARQEGRPPARTVVGALPAVGEEIGQIMIHPGQAGEVHRYTLGDREFLSRPIVGYIEKSQFYSMKVAGKETWRPLADAKLKIMQLGGVKPYGKFVEITGDACMYRAEAEWLSPSGETIHFERVRRISRKEERDAAIIDKARWLLKNLAESTNQQNRAKLDELQNKLKELILKKGMEMEQAILEIAVEVLQLQDIMHIEAGLPPKTFLPAITQTKAESQLGTAVLRYWGARLQYDQLPNDLIRVLLINTIEVPQGSGGTMNVLYGSDEEGDEMDRIETREIIQAEAQADDRETVIEVEAEVSEAVVVDVQTGEIIEPAEEASPMPEVNAEEQPREWWVGQFNAMATALKMSVAKRIKLIHDVTGGDGSLEKLDIDQLRAVVAELGRMRDGGAE